MTIGDSLSAADRPRESQRHESTATALDLMRKALKLLDEVQAPDEIGARLDEAIHRLQDWQDSER